MLRLAFLVLPLNDILGYNHVRGLLSRASYHVRPHSCRTDRLMLLTMHPVLTRVRLSPVSLKYDCICSACILPHARPLSM